MTEPLERMTLLIDAEHLRQGVEDMGKQIDKDFVDVSPDSEPVLVVVLKGGVVFGLDLLKSLHRPIPIVFISARASEEFFLTSEDQSLIQGRALIVADALMDTGGSLIRLCQWLKKFSPPSVRVAVLLHKTVSHAEPLAIDYLGFEVPDVRLVGYGLDEDQRFRGLPALYTWWRP